MKSNGTWAGMHVVVQNSGVKQETKFNGILEDILQNGGRGNNRDYRGMGNIEQMSESWDIVGRQ